MQVTATRGFQNCFKQQNKSNEKCLHTENPGVHLNPEEEICYLYLKKLNLLFIQMSVTLAYVQCLDMENT